MPFSKTKKKHTDEYWRIHFQNRLKPLIESETNLEAFRSEPLRQDMLRQIINDLVFSPLVVADLTDSNSNVYWELGVRQSFRHGTITIAEKGEKVPFDIASKAVLFYSIDDFDRDSEFVRLFRKAISDCVTNPTRPDSAVLETITGRGSVYSIIRRQEFIQRIDGLLAENILNRQILEEVMNQVRKNKGRRFSSFRTKYMGLVTTLGDSALGQLLAEHYLEEDPKFYEFCHTLLMVINAINSNLQQWRSSENPENWFVREEIFLKDMLGQYEEKLKATQQKLISSC
jgi:hypothetical protein